MEYLRAALGHADYKELQTYVRLATERALGPAPGRARGGAPAAPDGPAGGRGTGRGQGGGGEPPVTVSTSAGRAVAVRLGARATAVVALGSAVLSWDALSWGAAQLGVDA